MLVAATSTGTRGPVSLTPGISCGRATWAVRNPFEAAERRSLLWAATIMTCGGCQVERFHRREINPRFWLEVMRNLRTQDGVPGQIVPAADVRHQRDIAVRAGREDEFAMKPRKSGRHVRPRIQPVPRQRQLTGGFVVQHLETKFRPDLIEHAPVQHVELDEWLPPGAHFFHGWLIQRAPRIGKTDPVEVISQRLQDLFRLARDPVAPIDAGAKHVEHKSLYGICRRGLCPRMAERRGSDQG